jgi:hypothetical protein
LKRELFCSHDRCPPKLHDLLQQTWWLGGSLGCGVRGLAELRFGSFMISALVSFLDSL